VSQNSALKTIRPGDCLIFSRSGLFDDIIRVKTWSPATHVEIYLNADKTVASRNGKGVAIYPADLSGLYCVLRPQDGLFDINKAIAAFPKWNGRPYGWLALFSFCLIDLHDKGLFCSEFATLFYRDGGFDPFNETIKADTVAPATFLYSHPSVMGRVWQRP
jgi:hypothetical protein